MAKIGKLVRLRELVASTFAKICLAMRMLVDYLSGARYEYPEQVEMILKPAEEIPLAAGH